ncbi:MAG: hypothetical protein HY674_21105 [Chloroflexi bacterium]|nr:hypothetical protein [Chloroflexota bacterium]
MSPEAAALVPVLKVYAGKHNERIPKILADPPLLQLLEHRLLCWCGRCPNSSDV